MRLLPVRNTLDNILLNVSTKGMRPFDLVHLYELAAEYICLEGRHLVLTLLASLYLQSLIHFFQCKSFKTTDSFEILKRHGLIFEVICIFKNPLSKQMLSHI